MTVLWPRAPVPHIPCSQIPVLTPGLSLCLGALSSHPRSHYFCFIMQHTNTNIELLPATTNCYQSRPYSEQKQDHDMGIKLENLFGIDEKYWVCNYECKSYPQAGDSLIVSIVPVPFLRRTFEASLFFKTSYSRFTLIMASWFL